MTKRTIAEILFILLLALFISLMYNAASPTGVKLTKKTPAEHQPGGQKPQTAPLPGQVRK